MNNKKPTKSLFEVMGTLLETTRSQVVRALQEKINAYKEASRRELNDGKETESILWDTMEEAMHLATDEVKEVFLNVDLPDLPILPSEARNWIRWHMQYAYREIGRIARDAYIAEQEAQERDHVYDLNAKRWKDHKTGKYVKARVLDPVRDQWFELGVQHGIDISMMDFRIMRKQILKHLEET